LFLASRSVRSAPALSRQDQDHREFPVHRSGLGDLAALASLVPLGRLADQLDRD